MFVFKSKYNSKLAEVELLKKELDKIKSLHREAENKKSEISNETSGTNYDFTIIVKEKDKNIALLKSEVERLISDNEKQAEKISELQKMLAKEDKKDDQNLQDNKISSKASQTEINTEESIRYIFRKSYVEIKNLTSKLQKHYCDDNISPRTVERIFLYLEVLEEMNQEDFINSMDLGNMADIKSTTIRKDMTWLKISGVRGKGYSVKALKGKLNKFISLEGKIKPAKKSEAMNVNDNSKEDEALYTEISKISSEEWLDMASWSRENEMFDGWTRKFFFTFGVYKKNNGKLTDKQIQGISKYYSELKNSGYFEGSAAKDIKSEVQSEEKLIESEKNNEVLTFSRILETGLETGLVKGEILQNIDYSMEKKVKDIYEAVEILESRGIQIN